MAKMTISGEAPFQVEAHSFAIGPSESGYTLNYSADGENWTACSTITANDVTQCVCGAPFGLYYKLDGNTSDDVVIVY